MSLFSYRSPTSPNDIHLCLYVKIQLFPSAKLNDIIGEVKDSKRTMMRARIGMN